MFLLNLRLPLKTATSSPKLEKLSLAVWSLMSPWRKIATKIGPFQVFERTNSFPEIQTYFRVAKTALDLCTSKFLLRRFWSKDQNKLWRRNVVQSTYLSHCLRLKNTENILFLNFWGGFFWAHYVVKQWSLLNPSRLIFLQRLVANSYSSWAL